MVINSLRSVINFTSTKLLLNNGGFIINYSPEMGRPIWTAYSLNKFDIEKQTGGRTRFVCDPRLTDRNIYQLEPDSGIFNSNLTRGHLVPAFMMSHLKSTQKSWQKTFLMSNIVPQYRKLNMDNWNRLEIETRDLVSSSYSSVHVLVGCDSLEVSKKYFFSKKCPKNVESTNNLVWVDVDREKEYMVPNIFYQVIITGYEAKCWIGFNNSSQVVQPVSLDFLENLIDKKLLI